MSDLTFYTNPQSRGQTVRWMLEEIGQPYETRILGYGTTMKDEAYLAVNPMGKVPAIVHGGKVVTEVAAICCYLADAFPEAALAPDPQDRAEYYRWIFFTSGPVEAAFTPGRGAGNARRAAGHGRVPQLRHRHENAQTSRPRKRPTSAGKQFPPP